MKSAKRLLRTNVGPTGSLNTDRFLRAILQLRNTPDPDSKVSPAEIIYGRPIRDAFTFCNRRETFSNPQVQSHWKDAWMLKEQALRKRFVQWSERHNERTRLLRPLNGDRCFLQNQVGPHSRRWDRSGLIVDTLPYDQYVIKVDGSGRLTTRNRRYLRLFKNVSVSIPDIPGECASRKWSEPSRADAAPTTFSNRRSDEDRQADPVDQESFENNRTESVEPTTPEPTSLDDQCVNPPTTTRKMPLALRQLQPFNSPGVKGTEGIMPTRLRPRKTSGG